MPSVMTRKGFRYIPPGAVEMRDEHSDAVAYVYTNGQFSKPAAAVYYGEQSKPVANYFYHNEVRRTEHIEKLFAARRASLARKAERAAERKAFRHDTKVGDIYVASWGYEQTNVNFYEVTALVGETMVELREIAGEDVDRPSGPMSGYTKPKPGAFLSPRYDGDDTGLPMRRRVGAYGIKIDETRHAHKWDGKPTYWSSYY